MKTMKGGHGHSHGPMSSIKKGSVISQSMWLSMDEGARAAALATGARSPAMVAQKRIAGLLDSSGYVQGVACSVFQAVLASAFKSNSAYDGLANIICEYLFTEKLRSIRSFAKDCLVASVDESS